MDEAIELWTRSVVSVINDEIVVLKFLDELAVIAYWSVVIYENSSTNTFQYNHTTPTTKIPITMSIVSKIECTCLDHIKGIV